MISFMTASDEEKEEASGPIELTDKDEDDSEVEVVENLQQKQKGQLEKRKVKGKQALRRKSSQERRSYVQINGQTLTRRTRRWIGNC